MDIKELNRYYSKFKYGEDNFHDLMHRRIKEILLVSTFYDAYIFEHDAALTEKIVDKYKQLNLITVPRITSVPTGDEALRKLKEHQYDLVITTMRIGEITPFELSRRIKQMYPSLPILLLLTIKSDIALLGRYPKPANNFENIFIWNGDPNLFIAMVKTVEDKWNAEEDTKDGLVKVILLVEDSIKFQSSYLPLLYQEIMTQTQRLIKEELNHTKKYFRMKARPKVLIAKNYEEAITILNTFKKHILCVISDIQYKRSGDIDSHAGMKLLSKLKEQKWDIPVLLQSSDMELKEKAEKLGVHFIHKKSHTLLNETRNFFLDELGFGDFIFKNSAGNEIGRAKTMSELENLISKMPIESVYYHGSRNHFSAWLMAHGEFEVARRVRPVKINDFKTSDEYRNFLINVFKEVRLLRNRGKIIGFDVANLNNKDMIIRLKDGSLGGKGRGLAFFNSLLVTMEMDKNYKGTKIRIPTTAIIGTSEFDEFIDNNRLADVIGYNDDQAIKRRFLQAKLSDELMEKLTQYLKYKKGPLAIRSSGLLEDSQSQPFAGIYQTFMLPNNHPSLKKRLEMLSTAIKLVFSSVFLQDSRRYIDGLNYRIEEEKMAVILQGIVGNQYSDHFYPHFSGIAQSHNYYPISYLEHSDGAACIAVGLGQSVVEGGKSYRFCPRYPELQYLSTEDLVKSSQTEFYALNMKNGDVDLSQGQYETLARLPISSAEDDGTLYHLASVWNSQDQRIEEGLSSQGPRIVDFANILKYNFFPLAEILQKMLELTENALGTPVEIEFAVNLKKQIEEGYYPTFYFLQARPLTVNPYETDIEIQDIDRDRLFLYTEKSLGHGVIDHIQDIIYGDPDRFDVTKTEDMTNELERLNQDLLDQDREYILIGPGRWGSRDKFLGIPVTWGQICKAKVIVETGLKDFDIEPSQGTHFFHNLVALDIGYLNVPFLRNKGTFIDWSWLTRQKAHKKGKFFVHLHFRKPLMVKMDGRSRRSIIYKTSS